MIQTVTGNLLDADAEALVNTVNTVGIMELYGQPGYPLTPLEFQKLADLLQASGESLGLRFEQHIYGPYDDQLNHVLEAMEGHSTKRTRTFGAWPSTSRDSKPRMASSCSRVFIG